MNMCLAGDNGAVDEVQVVGGYHSLMLGVVLSLAGAGVSCGPSNMAWGSPMPLMVCVNLCVSPSLNLGFFTCLDEHF